MAIALDNGRIKQRSGLQDYNVISKNPSEIRKDFLFLSNLDCLDTPGQQGVFQFI
jgi:hypothetical protein